MHAQQPPQHRESRLASRLRRWFGLRRRQVGVAVVGHGTADPVGAEETLAVARMVAEMLPGIPVEPGFLEVIGPTIGDALARLAGRGCTDVVAAPLLLFTAGHARRDVPAAVRQGAEAAGVVVRQAEALGCHPAIVSLSRSRRDEAIASLPAVDAAHTLLLVVGRGASDPSAPAQLEAFVAATCRADEGRLPRLGFGFVAAARPTLAEAVVAAAAAAADDPPIRRVIVQPHLLFRGHVEEQVTAAVEEARRTHAGMEWIQVSRLGADPAVARAVVDRARAAAPVEL